MTFYDEDNLRRELERSRGYVGYDARRYASRLSERDVQRVVDDYNRRNSRLSYSDERRLREAARDRRY